IVLNHAANRFASADLTSSAGRIEVFNSATGSAGTTLKADAKGSVRYTGNDTVFVDAIKSGSDASGTSSDSAAVSLDATSIQAKDASAAGITVGAGRSVWLKGAQGIGDGINGPLRLHTGEGSVTATVQAAQAGVAIETDGDLVVPSAVAAAGASLASTGSARRLDLHSANVGGELQWNGFSSAALGAAASPGGATGTISAGGGLRGTSSTTDVYGRVIIGGSGTPVLMELGQNSLIIQQNGRLDFHVVNGQSDEARAASVDFEHDSRVGVTLDAATAASTQDKDYTLVRSTSSLTGSVPVTDATANQLALKVADGNRLLVTVPAAPVPPLPPPPPGPPGPPAPPAPPAPPGPPGPDAGGDTQPGSPSWSTQPAVAFEQAFSRYADEGAVLPLTAVQESNCTGLFFDDLDDLLCTR
ncbi:MAG: hypothetical protein ACLGIS_17020, partial [Actinomycetes bacterium]